ncbi:WD repeat-containing protein 86-like [Canna indica]|uniref:WD repeat-containing protein 86-like n=1 Tax=Canna indica TaxID=4628 RepID=A0AAQ3JMK7_9LILI|nr:WD repeat-containing protein 86-like [Canna indica]
MTDSNGGMLSPRRRNSKLFNMFNADATIQSDSEFPNGSRSCVYSSSSSPDYHSDRHGGSPYDMSPWNSADASPYSKSPWAYLPTLSDDVAGTGLVASLVREEGHVYSLAVVGDLLYTGSESRNIRVWKGHRELSGFKSSSGFVKTIVVAGDRIFTGHQDGKIRVWARSSKNPTVHKHVGTLPRLKDFLKSSINPSDYVEVRRQRRTVWLRHFDAVSCLSLDQESGILYSGSWDKTVKVWRISDSKCLESFKVHDDAVNSMATGFGGILFTGSADGTLKVWRREAAGKGGATRHVLVQTLLRQESAVTTVAVVEAAGAVYCGSSDGLVNYWWWDSAQRRLAHGGVLRGHRMPVLCLAAAGNLVVSGSADKTLCVWRREEGSGGERHTKLAVLAGHEGPIKCVMVVEEGAEGGDRPRGLRYVVYSGSLDNTVKVWRVLDSDATPEAHDEALRQRSPLSARGGERPRTSGGGKLMRVVSPMGQDLMGQPARVQAAA